MSLYAVGVYTIWGNQISLSAFTLIAIPPVYTDWATVSRRGHVSCVKIFVAFAWGSATTYSIARIKKKLQKKYDLRCLTGLNTVECLLSDVSETHSTSFIIIQMNDAPRFGQQSQFLINIELWAINAVRWLTSVRTLEHVLSFVCTSLSLSMSSFQTSSGAWSTVIYIT